MARRRPSEIVSLTRRARNKHDAYRHNAGANSMSGQALRETHAIASADDLAAAVHHNSHLLHAPLPTTKGYADRVGASLAAIEQLKSYANLLTELQSATLSDQAPRRVTPAEFADLIEDASLQYRSVVDNTRGLKPRRKKDELRDEAAREFRQIMCGFDLLAIAVDREQLRRRLGDAAGAVLNFVR